MKQTREEKLMTLLQETTNNLTAHSLVDATISNPKGFIVTLLFGFIAGALVSAKDESGFVMIDEGKLFFYKVTGLGKRQEIEGRREIGFQYIERVRHTVGKGRSAAALNIRWRNSDNKKRQLAIGTTTRQFPNQQAHINNMATLLKENNVEVKIDKSARNGLIALAVIFTILFALVGVLFLLEEAGII